VHHEYGRLDPSAWTPGHLDTWTADVPGQLTSVDEKRGAARLPQQQYGRLTLATAGLLFYVRYAVAADCTGIKDAGNHAGHDDQPERKELEISGHDASGLGV